MTLYHWSKTAASNGTADITCPFPEGMAASALNDGTRGMMAAVAKYRDDLSGQIVTTGTSTAYAVLSFQGFDSLVDMDGKEIAFSPHATNGDTVTINVDLFGAKPLRSAPGVELLAGTLVLGTPYMALYNNTDGAWYLKGYHANPFNIPFLGGMDYWDTIAPNSGFIFPMGQAISRVVYSRAFARWGTTFGAGDGSTTFNAPDKTERVSVMVAASASRLTSSYFGGNSTVIGAVGGGESHTLTANEQASMSVSASGTASVASTVSGIPFNATTGSSLGNGSNGGVLTAGVVGAPQPIGQISSTGTASVSGTATGGGAPHRTVQPTIVCNYIIRII